MYSNPHAAKSVGGRLAQTALAFVLALALAGGPALADPGKKGGHKGGGGRSEGGVSINIHIGDRDRVVIRDYFAPQVARGHCPPGLAKKRNGCLPPGHARPYVIGHALPRDVIYYDLPPQLVVQLTPPPSGYRYVRVAADILLIAVGTGLVAAAIHDLAQ